MEESAPSSIPALRFDTEAFPARDRFEAWRTVIAPLYEALPAGSESDRISVATTAWNLGDIAATHVRYSAQSSERPASLIRRSDTAAFRLYLPLTGPPVGFEVGDDRWLVPPGGLFLSDLAQPGRLVTSGANESVIVYLSRQEVEAVVPRAANLNGLMLEGRLTGLLRHHVAGLGAALAAPGTPASAAPALARATVQLLAAAVSGVAPREEARHALDDALRRRIADHVEAHLLEPELSQEQLCRTFHMSRATLYRVMQPLGGVASFVQERRLARIRAALLDPARHHHLGRLAEEHGFASQSHMSRAYKARYGVSPSETGSAAIAAVPADSDDRAEFARWLRVLGG